jgi:hypothetical protein
LIGSSPAASNGMYWSAGLWFKWPRGFIVKIEELKSEIAEQSEASND